MLCRQISTPPSGQRSSSRPPCAVSTMNINNNNNPSAVVAAAAQQQYQRTDPPDYPHNNHNHAASTTTSASDSDDSASTNTGAAIKPMAAGPLKKQAKNLIASRDMHLIAKVLANSPSAKDAKFIAAMLEYAMEGIGAQLRHDMEYVPKPSDYHVAPSKKQLVEGVLHFNAPLIKHIVEIATKNKIDIKKRKVINSPTAKHIVRGYRFVAECRDAFEATDLDTSKLFGELAEFLMDQVIEPLCSEGVVAECKAPRNPDFRKHFALLRRWNPSSGRLNGTLIHVSDLRELADKRPTTMQALAEIRGIGPKIVADHGATILSLLGVVARDPAPSTSSQRQISSQSAVAAVSVATSPAAVVTSTVKRAVVLPGANITSPPVTFTNSPSTIVSPVVAVPVSVFPSAVCRRRSPPFLANVTTRPAATTVALAAAHTSDSEPSPSPSDDCDAAATLRRRREDGDDEEEGLAATRKRFI